MMERLGMTGTASESTSDVPMTKEERRDIDRENTLHKCDSYNRSEGDLNERDGYDCPLCKNRGYTAEARQDPNFGYWSECLIPCKCQKVRATIKRLERSGLKNIIRDYTFKRYEAEDPWQQTLKNAAMRYAKNPDKNWFFLGGQSGCGKTHLCTAIAGYFLRHDAEVKYMLWRDDVARIKANMTNSEEYARLMSGFKTAPVLYVDDLFKAGKGPDGQPAMPSTADVNIAFEIINYRYNNPELITIISSERSIQDITAIDEAIGGRIAERTLQAGYGFNVKHDPAKNHRMKGVVDL